MSCTLIATTDFAKLPPPRFFPEPRVDGGPPARPPPPDLRVRGDNRDTLRRPKPPTRRGFLEPGTQVTVGTGLEDGSNCPIPTSRRFQDGCGNWHVELTYSGGLIPPGCPFPVPPSVPLGCR